MPAKIKRRIVLDLYDHTSDEEIADILAELRGIGLDGARVERVECIEPQPGLGGGNPHTLDIAAAQLAREAQA